MSYFMKQQVYSALWKPLDSISCLTRRYFATMNGNTTTTNGARHCTEPVKKSMKMSNDNVCDDEMRTQEDDFGSHENPMRLEVLRLSDKATLPKRGSPLAAGVDLYSAKDITIPAAGKALVPTDISIALPSNTYGRIAPRSSLAAKHHLDVGAGVIDEDYRGPVGVVMFNFGKDDYHVKTGERIAQLIVERIWRPDVVEVSKLSETVRGEGGFGSTGKH